MSAVVRFLHRRRGWIALLAVAVITVVFRVPVLSAQGTTLAATQVTGIPLDHASPVWSRASPITLPLAAQGQWIPNGGGTVAQVTVRALRNATWIGFLVEWADATKDVNAYRTEDFADAVAVQIAAGSSSPFVCMGQADSQVQIWHWRANRDTAAGADPSLSAAYPYTLANDYPFMNDATFYPGWAAGNFLSAYNTTPVQTLVAAGPGTLTSADAHTVFGRGHWEAGTWHVVFLRPLVADSDEEVPFAAGGQYAVAFAAWDGSSGDRDGMKSTSSWVTLSLPQPGQVAGDWLLFLSVGGVVAVVLCLPLLAAWRRRRREGRDLGGVTKEGGR